jgi:hypothetical protein
MACGLGGCSPIKPRKNCKKRGQEMTDYIKGKNDLFKKYEK